MRVEGVRLRVEGVRLRVEGVILIKNPLYGILNERLVAVCGMLNKRLVAVFGILNQRLAASNSLDFLMRDSLLPAGIKCTQCVPNVFLMCS